MMQLNARFLRKMLKILINYLKYKNLPKILKSSRFITILATKLCPEGLRVPEGSRFERKAHHFVQNPTAHFHLKRIVFGQNCSSHACARIKRLIITPLRGVIPPPSGVVREPGSRRLTVRYEKRK